MLKWKKKLRVKAIQTQQTENKETFKEQKVKVNNKWDYNSQKVVRV